MRARDPTGCFPGLFTLRRCHGCGLVRTEPRPTDGALMAAYSSPVFQLFLDCGKELPRSDVGAARRFLRSVDALRPEAPIGPDTRILDVGCGLGTFLASARQLRPFHPMGVDVSEPSVAHAREVLNLSDVHLGELEDLHLPERSVDVVRLWHVLEHLAVPARTLGEVRRILRDDGLLVLQVPSYRNVIARLFQSRWIFHFMPFHLYQFTPRTLTRLLERAGLRVVRVEGEAQPLELSGSLFQLVGGDLRRLLERRTRLRRTPAGRALAGVRFLALALLLWPLFALEHLLLLLLALALLGGNMTVYCRKSP